jgi:Protein of unknown function (DUF3750)
MNIIVDLRSAKIPKIGLIAVHYWFVIREGKQEERWEIWQTKQVGKISWGHLHLNLMKGDRGVGNGDSVLENQWHNSSAQKITDIIRASPQIYPYNYLYRYYPGPNSNTYVQWILDKAEISYNLSIRGIGKNYRKYWKFYEVKY